MDVGIAPTLILRNPFQYVVLNLSQEITSRSLLQPLFTYNPMHQPVPRIFIVVKLTKEYQWTVLDFLVNQQLEVSFTAVSVTPMRKSDGGDN